MTAALATSLELWLSGTARLDIVVPAMLFVHALIGIGEALITVAAPNYLHAQMTVDAANVGKHVVCEKPLCMTLEEADLMIDTCRRQGVLLMYAEELFFTPKDVAGTGWGLSIAYGIVQQAGGFVRLESEAGRGTVFRVHFPCV